MGFNPAAAGSEESWSSTSGCPPGALQTTPAGLPRTFARLGAGAGSAEAQLPTRRPWKSMALAGAHGLGSLHGSLYIASLAPGNRGNRFYFA